MPKGNTKNLSASSTEIDRLKKRNVELQERLQELEAAATREKEKADFYRTVADFTYDWEYWIDPEGVFRYISPSCERVTGYPPGAFMEDPDLLLRIVHPDDQGKIARHHIGRAVSETDHAPIEFRIITAAGDIRWIAHACQPVFDGEGEFAGRRGSNRDVTDLKVAEDALGRYEKRFHLALDAVSDGVWEWDLQSGEVYFSSRYCTMLGYAPNELEPSLATWKSLLHPEDRERVMTVIRGHIDRGAAFDIEFRLRSKSGEWQWVLGRGRVIEWDGAGRPRRVAGAHVDIHERKQMTEQLKRHIRELEVLNDVSRSAAMDHSLQDVTEAAMDRIMEALSPDLAVLCLTAGDDRVLHAIRTDMPDFDKDETTRHRVGECLCGRAARGGTPLFSLNIHEDDRCTHRECKAAGIRSFASLPLLSGAEVIGVLGFGSIKERDFSLRASFLQSMAAMISTGIANARLHQQVRAHARELEATVARRTAELKKFQNAVEHSPASIVITDAEGAIEHVNPFFTRMTGYAAEEAMGQNPRILKSGLHDDAFYADMWRTLKAKLTWRGEICNRKKDGALYWESAAISPLLDASGAISHFIAVKEDITEKKGAQRALQESEMRYKTIFNASRDGILLTDRRTREFIHANEALCQMLGYDAVEFLTRSMSDIHPENDLPMVLEAFERQARGEIDFAPEIPCRRKDGGIFYCDISAAAVAIDNRVCVMGFFRDVTERIEATRLKEEVDRMMRHDLRSPLNGIIGVPQVIMEDDNLTKEQKNLLQHLMDAGHKMLGMINLSSTLYQIEKGVYEPAWNAFNLLDILRTCMKENSSHGRSKMIDIHLSTAGFGPSGPDEIFVKGEVLLSYSVFSNLLLNAVEASPRGAPVTIRIERAEAIHVGIHNMGVVHESVRDRFFDKYVTQGKKRGTGLGTYSAKLLAEVQGWSISMKTDRDAGTVVTISIPI